MKKISQLTTPLISCAVQYRKSNKKLHARTQVSKGTFSSKRISEIQHLPRPMCAKLADQWNTYIQLYSYKTAYIVRRKRKHFHVFQSFQSFCVISKLLSVYFTISHGTPNSILWNAGWETWLQSHAYCQRLCKITSFKLNTSYTTKEKESVQKFGILHSYAIFWFVHTCTHMHIHTHTHAFPHLLTSTYSLQCITDQVCMHTQVHTFTHGSISGSAIM